MWGVKDPVKVKTHHNFSRIFRIRIGFVRSILIPNEISFKVRICACSFLAHLSQRLIPMLWRLSSSSSSSSSTISNIFFSETACPIKVKFYVEPPWVGGTIFCSRHLGHMTKMAATPIYGKSFKNLLLQNRWADFHETWYVASGTPVHHSLFKW